MERDDWVAPLQQYAPQGATLLFAYVTGSADTVWKLYTNAQLTEYVEVADRDIVWSVHLTGDRFPLGGSFVWIRRDAHVQHVQTSSRQAQAGMLAGNDFARVGAGQNTTFQPPESAGLPTIAQITPITPIIGRGGPLFTPFTPTPASTTCYTTSNLPPC